MKELGELGVLNQNRNYIAYKEIKYLHTGGVICVLIPKKMKLFNWVEIFYGIIAWIRQQKGKTLQQQTKKRNCFGS